MWSNGWIWIFYHYIKGARQTDQYGFCPSFLSTDPWAIYLPSEADPWVKFPVVFRSVHLFVPTASTLYSLFTNDIETSCIDTSPTHSDAFSTPTCWSTVMLHVSVRVCRGQTQSWLICLSRDSSSAADLPLFVFTSPRMWDAKGKDRVCVCVCAWFHPPPHSLASCHYSGTYPGRTQSPSHSVMSFLFTLILSQSAFSALLNCDGRNEDQLTRSHSRTVLLLHTRRGSDT